MAGGGGCLQDLAKHELDKQEGLQLCSSGHRRRFLQKCMHVSKGGWAGCIAMANAEGRAQWTDTHALARPAEKRIRQAGCWPGALCQLEPFSTGAPCRQRGRFGGEQQMQQA